MRLTLLKKTGCILSMTMVVAMVTLLPATPAFSHGEAKAQHGGQIQSRHDLAVELVRHSESIELHLTDHGDAIDPTGWQGKITVLAAGQKQDIPLVVTGQTLSAGLSLPDGAKVVVSLTNPQQQRFSFRYSF